MYDYLTWKQNVEENTPIRLQNSDATAGFCTQKYAKPEVFDLSPRRQEEADKSVPVPKFKPQETVMFRHAPTPAAPKELLALDETPGGVQEIKLTI